MTHKVLIANAQQIAEAFVTARRDGSALPLYPGDRPATLDEAYAIQDRAIALDGREIAGWKVGRINPPFDLQLVADRLAGPIFADHVARNHGRPEGGAPVMRVFPEGFVAVEAEFLIHLAPGWHRATPRDNCEVVALIDDVRLGIEIASSPYARINADGPCVTVSDFGNNCGMVIGAPLPGWPHRDFAEIAVTTLIDGVAVGEATTATMLDGPLGAVRFLLGNLAARGYDTGEGLWISTGAITGVHQARPGSRVEARFADAGSVFCTLAPRAGT